MMQVKICFQCDRPGKFCMTTRKSTVKQLPEILVMQTRKGNVAGATVNSVASSGAATGASTSTAASRAATTGAAAVGAADGFAILAQAFP